MGIHTMNLLEESMSQSFDDLENNFELEPVKPNIQLVQDVLTITATITPPPSNLCVKKSSQQPVSSMFEEVKQWGDTNNSSCKRNKKDGGVESDVTGKPVKKQMRDD